MKRVDDFVLQDLGGEAILVPTGQKVMDLNGLVTLNATGRCVWLALAEERSLASLVETVCAAFEVQPAQAEPDVASFLAELQRLGAVES